VSIVYTCNTKFVMHSGVSKYYLVNVLIQYHILSNSIESFTGAVLKTRFDHMHILEFSLHSFKC